MGGSKRNNKADKEEDEILFKGDGTLFAEKTRIYQPFGNRGDFTIELVAEESRRDGTSYYIVVIEGDETVLRQPIGNGLSLGYSRKEFSVHWPAIVDNKLTNMAFKFEDHNATVTAETLLARFVEMFNRCTYALLTDTNVSTDDMDDEFYDYLGGIASSKLPNDDYTEPMYELDTTHERSQVTGSGNLCSVDSRRFNRTVVLRESKNGNLELQAHAIDENGFTGASPTVFGVKGICDSALIDDSERKLLLVDAKENQIRELDLEYGKIVQEYCPSKDYPIQALTYAEHVPATNPLYTCLASNIAFNIDLRMDPRNNIDMDPGKTVGDYALGSLKKPLTCHATTVQGHLVTGDAMGNVRLYTGPPGSRRQDGSRNPKTAKTLLETKVPIIALDVTSDGEWVVAVCSKHLLLMQTSFHDDKKDTNGFMARMGRKKPAPLMLQPSAAQLAAIGGVEKLNFTTGGFDRYGGKEVCLTAASGNYIFTWSLDAAIQAESTGRSCLGECALVKGEVIGVSTSLPGKATYLTHRNVHIAPLKRQDRMGKGMSSYTYQK